MSSTSSSLPPISPNKTPPVPATERCGVPLSQGTSDDGQVPSSVSTPSSTPHTPVVAPNNISGTGEGGMCRALIGMSREALTEEMVALGEKPFRAKQLWHWMYDRGVQQFADMHNVSKALKEKLEAHYTLERPAITWEKLSSDETRKWLLRFQDGQEVETVYIPEEQRGTVCLSSQIGCTLTCSFCHTGTQRLVRNLTAEEIVGQLLIVRDRLGEWPSTREPRLVSNIVMMGMGEPLYNYEAVAEAIRIMTDGDGIALSRRRVTLSTSGVVPLIERCGRELGVNLAVSLHAVRDDIRNTLVPLNKKYPIRELLEACRQYPAPYNTRRITFEYVMLDGINDSDADAKELIKLIRGIPALINLIPFNPWPGSPYTCSSPERIRSFAEIVKAAGYASPVRTPRGQDILAACGQLRSESQRMSKRRKLGMGVEEKVKEGRATEGEGH